MNIPIEFILIIELELDHIILEEESEKSQKHKKINKSKKRHPLYIQTHTSTYLINYTIISTIYNST